MQKVIILNLAYCKAKFKQKLHYEDKIPHSF